MTQQNVLAHDFKGTKDTLVKNPQAKTFKNIAVLLWHPVEDKVLAVNSEGGVYIDNLSDGSVEKINIKTLQGLSPINRATFSKEGKLLITGVSFGTTKDERYKFPRATNVWSLDQKELIMGFDAASFTTHPTDENIICWGQENGCANIYDIEYGQVIAGFRKDKVCEDEPTNLLYSSHDVNSLLEATWDWNFDAQATQENNQLKEKRSILHPVKEMLLKNLKRGIQSRLVQTEKSFLSGLENLVAGFYYSATGMSPKNLTSAAQENSIQADKSYITLWDVRNTLDCVKTIEVDFPSSVQWHPTEKIFLFGTQNPQGTVLFYDARNMNQPLAQFNAAVEGHNDIDPIDYHFEWLKKDGQDAVAFGTNYGGFGYYDLKSNKTTITTLDDIGSFEMLDDKNALIGTSEQVAIYKVFDK